MTRRQLPQFCVIGAVKAATTWIQAQLQCNPAIYMPGPEPHFFSRDFERGWDYYETFFLDAPQGVILGEKSADYLAHPLAPSRMAKALPDIPLLVQLRDPVERAYSDYKMLFRRGDVSGKVEDYLTSLDNPEPRFLKDGLYGEHLQRWFDHFPKRNIFAFLFEDIREDGQTVVEKVSKHIRVVPVYDAAFASSRQNDSRAKLLPLPMRRALAPFKATIEPLRGHPAFERFRSIFARDIAYPPLESDLEKRMREFYLPDIELLENLLQRDLSRWKQPPGPGQRHSSKSGRSPSKGASKVSIAS